MFYITVLFISIFLILVLFKTILLLLASVLDYRNICVVFVIL